jgi:hypothetical protein
VYFKEETPKIKKMEKINKIIHVEKNVPKIFKNFCITVATPSIMFEDDLVTLTVGSDDGENDESQDVRPGESVLFGALTRVRYMGINKNTEPETHSVLITSR